jgi:hypothetical protein
MFIYGLNPDSATQKVFEILQTIYKNSEGKLVDILVSSHSITLLGVYPFRHIQIVLRLYRLLLIINLLT